MNIVEFKGGKRVVVSQQVADILKEAQANSDRRRAEKAAKAKKESQL